MIKSTVFITNLHATIAKACNTAVSQATFLVLNTNYQLLRKFTPLAVPSVLPSVDNSYRQRSCLPCHFPLIYIQLTTLSVLPTKPVLTASCQSFLLQEYSFQFLPFPEGWTESNESYLRRDSVILQPIQEEMRPYLNSVVLFFPPLLIKTSFYSTSHLTSQILLFLYSD